MRERIRVFVYGAGRLGVTSREIAANFGQHPNQFSGRITELKRDELIFDSGRVREGCAVLVYRREWCNGSAQPAIGA